MVMLYHAFARWPELYPYGDRFIGTLGLDTQTAGVRLFFMISGFVILKSLRGCPSFAAFIYRRWRRLFPAILICSIIVFFSADLFCYRPEGPPNALQLLPGLTLMGASSDGNSLFDTTANILGHQGAPIKSLEGSFWSLYVEVKFYFLFGATFFALGEEWAIGVIAALFFFTLFADKTFYYLQYHHIEFDLLDQSKLLLNWLHSFTSALRCREYGWFVAGALFYKSSAKSASRNHLYYLAAFLAALSAYFAYEGTTASVVIAIVFALSIQNDRLKTILANPLFIFLGFVSYPLYLLHENMMVSMIRMIGHLALTIPDMMIPLLPISVVVAIAWVIAKYLEPQITLLSIKIDRVRVT